MAIAAAAIRASPGHAGPSYGARLYFARRGCECSGGATMKHWLIILFMIVPLTRSASGQLPSLRTGDAIPRDMREIYDRGVQYLVSKQSANGEWTGGGEQGPGVTGMALMVLLASGEDPNFGLYASNARR